MDRTTKIIALIGLANIIMVCVACSYIPQTGGAVPQDMDLATFQAQQQQVVYASTPFKITMGGVGGGIFSIICLLLRAYLSNRREERLYVTAVSIRPILKVKRTAILPEPVPQVVIPVTEVQAQPSISPPAQLVQGGFEILELKPQAQVPQAQVPQAQVPQAQLQQKKIQYPGELRRTFKYPPPYDVLNK